MQHHRVSTLHPCFLFAVAKVCEKLGRNVFSKCYGLHLLRPAVTLWGVPCKVIAGVAQLIRQKSALAPKSSKHNEPGKVSHTSNTSLAIDKFVTIFRTAWPTVWQDLAVSRALRAVLPACSACFRHLRCPIVSHICPINQSCVDTFEGKKNWSVKELLIFSMQRTRDNPTSRVLWPNSEGIALIPGSAAFPNIQSFAPFFVFEGISQSCHDL